MPSLKLIKNNYFITTFLIINLIFIFAVIFKKSYEAHLMYIEQKIEKEIAQIKEKNIKLEEKLFQLKDPKKIKAFAQENLKMRDTKINQLKKINNDIQDKPQI